MMPLTISLYLYKNSGGGLHATDYFETECVMAVQGHPRSLILVPIEAPTRLPISEY